MYIRISLSTKFQLKLIMWIFWTKFAQKGYFRSKTEQLLFRWVHGHSYNIKLLPTGTVRCNSILMSLLLLVAEATKACHLILKNVFKFWAKFLAIANITLLDVFRRLFSNSENASLLSELSIFWQSKIFPCLMVS